jgi:hypothetical protein
MFQRNQRRYHVKSASLTGWHQWFYLIYPQPKSDAEYWDLKNTVNTYEVLKKLGTEEN